MDKKGWFSPEKLKGISKNHLLIGALVGVLLLVVAMPVGQEGSKEKEGQAVQETAGEDRREAGIYSRYGKELERKLKQVLEKVEGVGAAEVMITLQDEGERVVEKDLSQTGQSVSEKDGDVSRSTQEKQYQEETVFSQGEGSGGEPFVAREVMPKVEGVLVVAEGGGDPKVAKNISDAVLALFPVEVHKIKVVKMN
ncbi:MAG: stage III sporulation protein AG [Lachnospiraceae bacterium]|jgi:stage III sporulation protein AG|nr:stage III sporulation protein AG [Lachnospiraceae bacterium]